MYRLIALAHEKNLVLNVACAWHLHVRTSRGSRSRHDTIPRGMEDGQAADNKRLRGNLRTLRLLSPRHHQQEGRTPQGGGGQGDLRVRRHHAHRVQHLGLGRKEDSEGYQHQRATEEDEGMRTEQVICTMGGS